MSSDSLRNDAPERLILLTGATGYIGGRLAPALLERGHRVRCLVRDAGKLRAREWAGEDRVEILEGSLEQQTEIEEAMRGCDAAYYLVHSMVSAGSSYAKTDERLAGNFAAAAAAAGVERIIYLGGLGETGDHLSRHLASRREVEDALAAGTVPVTVLRAAMIVGSGSASFEILRYLVERLPIMVTPRWVRTESQPIAVRDVLFYLVQCLDTPETTGRTLDIGGPDVLAYHALMKIMAEELHLPRRLIIPVPVLTPRLSSLWIHLVTPIDHRIARPLAEGLRNRVVCRNGDAAALMPQQAPLSIREAIADALGRLESGDVPTAWSDAGVMPGDPDWAGGTVFDDERGVEVEASAADVFRAVCRVGGGHGYYASDWLWRLRGAMDRLIGGPGLRRGRRDPERVAYGDALDFWRVTGIEPDRRLALRAEMRLPGVASLEFEIEPLETPLETPARCRLIQKAHFKPKGLLGIAYWYGVLPLHGIVFRGMLDGIRNTAESAARDADAAAVAETNPAVRSP